MNQQPGAPFCSDLSKAGGGELYSAAGSASRWVFNYPRSCLGLTGLARAGPAGAARTEVTPWTFLVTHFQGAENALASVRAFVYEVSHNHVFQVLTVGYTKSGEQYIAWEESLARNTMADVDDALKHGLICYTQA